MVEQLEQLKYPIGKFRFPGHYDDATRKRYKQQISELPAKLRSLTENLSEEELNRPYRRGGWTVRQVIHHLADSHLNSIIRFKLALTEEAPTIKPYKEAAWANLPDVAKTPIVVSLQLLEALHMRWSNLLDSFSEAEWQRKVFHPERNGNVTLEEFLGLYAWHGEHHLEHIRIALRG